MQVGVSFQIRQLVMEFLNVDLEWYLGVFGLAELDVQGRFVGGIASGAVVVSLVLPVKECLGNTTFFRSILGHPSPAVGGECFHSCFHYIPINQVLSFFCESVVPDPPINGDFVLDAFVHDQFVVASQLVIVVPNGPAFILEGEVLGSRAVGVNHVVPECLC